MVAVQRLANQHLASPQHSAPELVRTMLAMQAQDYAGGLWAVGARTRNETEESVEAALVEGTILRTHPMRGTHHFVTREDIRWLIALMGPLMIRRNARRNRELELEEKTLSRAMSALERALAGGNHLTRAEIAGVLRKARIAPDGQRLAHIVYRAELEGLVCSGKRKGKQVTIALLDERAPAGKAKPRSREESLADLAQRYFSTRGPATQKDFAWWCQLPAEDIRAAMALAKLDSDGELHVAGKPRKAKSDRAFLLPPYDEYTVAYSDRSAVGTPPPAARTFGEMALLAPLIILDGRAIGSWKRKVSKRGVSVELTAWTKIAPRDRAAVDEAGDRYAAFLGLPRI